jgi:hypothetical protein
MNSCQARQLAPVCDLASPVKEVGMAGESWLPSKLDDGQGLAGESAQAG